MDVCWCHKMEVTVKNEGRCKPDTAVHSLFCEMRRLETVKSNGET